MDRIAISETLAARIRNSFLKNENSFQQAMKQRVLLERIFRHKSYEQNRNFRDSCLKNLEFFFVGIGFFLVGKEVKGSSGKNV